MAAHAAVHGQHGATGCNMVQTCCDTALHAKTQHMGLRVSARVGAWRTSRCVETRHCNTVRRVATRDGAVQHGLARCNAGRRGATRDGAVQHGLARRGSPPCFGSGCLPIPHPPCLSKRAYLTAPHCRAVCACVCACVCVRVCVCSMPHGSPLPRKRKRALKVVHSYLRLLTLREHPGTRTGDSRVSTHGYSIRGPRSGRERPAVCAGRQESRAG
jgi:hypothetical protein